MTRLVMPRRTFSIFSSRTPLFKTENVLKAATIDILIIRVSADGLRIRNSKPCIHCAEKIKMSGITNVHYSNSEGFIISEKVDSFISDHKTRKARWKRVICED
jgi:hypothetical protein